MRHAMTRGYLTTLPSPPYRERQVDRITNKWYSQRCLGGVRNPGLYSHLAPGHPYQNVPQPARCGRYLTNTLSACRGRLTVGGPNV